MDKPGGVGEPSFKPVGETPQTGPAGPSEGKEAGLQAAMKTPVHSLGELKQMLIANLGEKDGTKFFNMFMKTVAFMMISQVQSSAEQAKKAAHEMRVKR